MFGIDRAALWVSRFGITRLELEEALRSGELRAGTSAAGWVIDGQDLEEWAAARS